MIDFKLPSLGADMDEGTLLEWRVAPGQGVNKGDIIAVVDTSKAAIDIEVWEPGTVHELIAQVGQTIPVGTVMARLLAPGEAAGEPAAGAPAVAAAAPKATVAPAPPPGATVTPAAAPAGLARRPVTPAARRRAAELAVALETVAGTGPDGAITLADVERAAQRPVAAPAPLDRGAEMRKVIAAAMARSKREIPHYYLAEPVPMRGALDWLRGYNANQPVTQRLLSAVLLLKAVALALREVPEMNGLFVDGAFRPASAAHVGVAISLRRGGLVAPALHDVGDKTLPQLMTELGDLVQRARAFSLRSSEMADPTITVTNLGDTGVEAVHGVIYPPQVALVGFGRIAERPWVEEGRIVAMPTLTATLAADHRVSDGHRGAIFLARVRDLLQRPAEL
ncbi:dihydrolipoamide acetyltransferase family protein [uncultured Piscinibacter sp.]|uniref:dihydrolipoamide acetyltransferase family protein n=1 Tax=uncultured Piscinibacter sp. TaxID=1131835 RepID=UPI0026107906|nr:dihydrolipoamide acetyltransferase family protein [uncultured Piscinibacter sp.]